MEVSFRELLRISEDNFLICIYTELEVADLTLSRLFFAPLFIVIGLGAWMWAYETKVF